MNTEIQAISKNWQRAVILPIYKEGDRQDCTNYDWRMLFMSTHLKQRITVKRGQVVTEDIFKNCNEDLWAEEAYKTMCLWQNR